MMKLLQTRSLAAVFLLLFCFNAHAVVIDVIKPRTCPELPSPLIYPSFLLPVEFKIFDDSLHLRYQVFIEQKGQTVMLDEGLCSSGQRVTRSLNISNFPALCYNELAVIRIKAFREAGNYYLGSKLGYFIAYKPVGCEYFAAINGTSQLHYTGIVTFFTLVDCSLASANYYVKRYKVSFSVAGNFNGMHFEVVKPYTLGYSGASPNYQNLWGYLESVSPNELRFFTFVYDVISDPLGRYVGWWPCRPEEAAVVYKQIVVPNIANLSQIPNPICPQNNLGFIRCNLSQGNGNLEYHWDTSNAAANNCTVEFLGNSVRVIKNYGSGPGIKDGPPLPPLSVKCYVTNQAGQSPEKQMEVSLMNQCSSGCPTLQFMIKDVELDENSILVNSPSYPGIIVRDFYTINNPFIEESSIVKLRIHEPGSETSELDNVMLEIYSIDRNDMAAVTSEGELVNYKKPAKISKIILNEKTDLSATLSEADNNVYEAKQGDKLVIQDEALTIGEPGVLLRIRAPVEKERPAGSVVSDGGVHSFYSRNNETAVCIKLRRQVNNQVNISFEQGVIVDQVIVVNDLNTSVPVPVDFVSASHSSQGDVTRLLRDEDGIFADLGSGQFIDFVFSGAPWGKPVYILKSVGKYSSLPDGTSVGDPQAESRFRTSLYANSPNPFNPVTYIRYELSRASHVTLKVYDVTGREVSTLVDDIRTEGIHEEMFDGSNLASGIYFYRLTAGNFSAVRKMSLIK